MSRTESNNTIKIVGIKNEECCYGDNHSQTPADFYVIDDSYTFSFQNFEKIAGAPMSANNIGDFKRLVMLITHAAAGFSLNLGEVPYIAIAVKHGNPCGAAIGRDQKYVLEQMLRSDLISIHGGSVITNFRIDKDEAKILRSSYLDETTENRILDLVIAPEITRGAVALLERPRDKCRMRSHKKLANLSASSMWRENIQVCVPGGFIDQPNYTYVLDFISQATDVIRTASTSTISDIILAWSIGSMSNSNTITLVRDGQLLANGCGQQSRKRAVKVACMIADECKHDLTGAVGYSDSFFAFVDALELLADRGIQTLFASSGSINDGIVRTRARELGVTLIQFPNADCRGFFHP